MPTRTGMSLISFLIAGFLFFSLPLSAGEIEIVDPDQTLQRFPFRPGAVDFSNAFQCNRPLSFFTKTGQCKIYCDEFMCEQQCSWDQFVEAQFQAEECSADQVMIYSSLGHSITATKTDYQLSANSIVFTLLKAIPIFYEHIEKIEISSASIGVRKGLIENGKLKMVHLTTLHLSIFPNKNKPKSASLMLHLDLDQAGLDQLMCLSEDGFCDPLDHYLMKRKGLVNANF